MSIYKKYLDVIKAIDVVGKDAVNPFAKSKYATLTNIINKVQPLLNKHGLVLKFEFPTLENDSYLMTAKLIDTEPTIIGTDDKGGKYIDNENLGEMNWTFTIPHDQTQKNKTQGFGSTMTYAQRYAYAIIFQIPFDSEDPDASTKPGTNAAKADDEPDKPWLNKGTTQFADAVKFMQDGGSVADVRKKYKVSNAVADELNLKAQDKIKSAAVKDKHIDEQMDAAIDRN